MLVHIDDPYSNQPMQRSIDFTPNSTKLSKKEFHLFPAGITNVRTSPYGGVFSFLFLNRFLNGVAVHIIRIYM